MNDLAIETRTWRLVHDGSAGALLATARAALAGADERLLDRVIAQDDDDAIGADAWLAVVDLHRAPDVLALQRRAASAGAALLVVGLEPGSATIGPWIAPGATTGCLGCQRRWLANNLRQPGHWADTRQSPAPLRRAAQAPLAPAAGAVFARLLEQALAEPQALAGRARRLQWATLTDSSHRFHVHPDCPDCARAPADSAARATPALAARPLARAGDTRVPNPRLTLAGLRDAFLDRRSGLVKHVFHDLTSDLMPMVAAEMPMRGAVQSEIGYGRTEGRDASERVALLEVLERFCGHGPRATATTVRGSHDEVRARYPGQVIDPREFILHEAAQLDAPGFALEPFSDALAVDWCWGFSMRRRAPVLVPQQLVYYRLGDKPGAPQNRFVYESSSGCAMGGCFEEAALYGLFEVLERDAYLTSWYGRIAPRPIALDTVADARVRALLARCRAQGFDVHAFDMRLDVDVPLVWALIADPRPDAPVRSYCASAAHFRWEQALFGALVEVSSSIGVYQRTMPGLREQARAMAADASLVQKMSDHVTLYSLPETWPRLGFLFGEAEAPLPAARGEDAPRDLRDELERRVAQTLAVARDVIVVDQTWAPMREAGLHCVKVLAPGLTPVTFGHQHRRVALDRVNAALAARGHAPIAASQLNPEPHNFP